MSPLQQIRRGHRKVGEVWEKRWDDRLPLPVVPALSRNRMKMFTTAGASQTGGGHFKTIRRDIGLEQRHAGHLGRHSLSLVRGHPYGREDLATWKLVENLRRVSGRRFLWRTPRGVRLSPGKALCVYDGGERWAVGQQNATGPTRLILLLVPRRLEIFLILPTTKSRA